MNTIGLKILIRWLARLSSLASILIIGLFFFVGQEEQSFQNLNEVLGFVFFPVGVLAGFIVAWKLEMLGAAISIASLMCFYLWHYLGSGDLPTGPWFFVFAAPAFVFLLIPFIPTQKDDN